MIPIRLLRTRVAKHIGPLGGRTPIAVERRDSRRAATVLPSHARFLSNKSSADEVIEEIQDQ